MNNNNKTSDEKYSKPFLLYERMKLFVSSAVAIDLIVQHIRDFLNNRGRSIEAEARTDDDQNDEGQGNNESTSTSPIQGKKKIESHSHNMHRPH